MPKQKLCPECNYDEDIDLFEKKLVKKNRTYELQFMNRLYIRETHIDKGKRKQKWIKFGWYCHECDHIEDNKEKNCDTCQHNKLYWSKEEGFSDSGEKIEFQGCDTCKFNSNLENNWMECGHGEKD